MRYAKSCMASGFVTACTALTYLASRTLYSLAIRPLYSCMAASGIDMLDAGCSIANTPKSNTLFWAEKFDKNIARDARVATELEKQGWSVIVIWECELASTIKARATGERVGALIRQSPTQLSSENRR